MIKEKVDMHSYNKLLIFFSKCFELVMAKFNGDRVSFSFDLSRNNPQKAKKKFNELCLNNILYPLDFKLNNSF